MSGAASVTPETSFVRDDRGVVVVLGLLMATFLIGTCWYVFGIGNAIQYRENLQNAADASAFAAAVFDARGMNVLSLINLLMTTVMMVLVAVRLVQAINFIVNIVSCIFGAFLDPLCDISSGFEVPLAETADDVGNIVVPSVRVMHYTEGFIAIVWPWMAEGKSMEASLPYQPGAVMATTWATAMVPMSMNTPGDFSNVLTNSINFESIFSGGGMGLQNPLSGQGADGWFQGRYGLPVQNDTINNLCSTSGEYIVDILGILSIPVLNVPLLGGAVQAAIGAVKDTIGWITGQVPQFFCNNDSGALMSAVNLLRGNGAGGAKDGDPKSTKSLGQTCSDEQSGSMSKGQKTCPAGSPKTGCAPTGDGKPPTGCTSICGLSASLASSYGTGLFNECMKNGGGNNGSTQADLVTKILYGNANMGDDNFAVWSTAVGNWDDIANRGVAVGALFSKNASMVGPPPADVLNGVAKAEFYYEPRVDSDSMEHEIHDVPASLSTQIADDKNCMWNMRWRARLRRYRTPAPAFAFAASNGIRTLFNSTLNSMVGGLSQSVGGAGGALVGKLGGANDPYSSTCSNDTLSNLNPLCAVYSAEAQLPWPADPGTTNNPDAPAPGIYH